MSDVLQSNITIHKYTDFVHQFLLKKADGTAFDLTGYTADSEIRNAANHVFVDDLGVSLTAVVSDALTGELTVSLSDDLTAVMADTPLVGALSDILPRWDLVIVDAALMRTKIVQGLVNIVDTQSRI